MRVGGCMLALLFKNLLAVSLVSRAIALQLLRAVVLPKLPRLFTNSFWVFGSPQPLALKDFLSVFTVPLGIPLQGLVAVCAVVLRPARGRANHAAATDHGPLSQMTTTARLPSEVPKQTKSFCLRAADDLHFFPNSPPNMGFCPMLAPLSEILGAGPAPTASAIG